MGCGKSKHAVVSSTTVVKSMKSDDGKETHTTKTVMEKGDSSVVETKSLVVENTKKETVTTKIDPPDTTTTTKIDPPDTTTTQDDKIKTSSPTNTIEPNNGDVGLASTKDILVKQDDHKKNEPNVASVDLPQDNEAEAEAKAKTQDVAEEAIDNTAAAAPEVKDSKEKQVESEINDEKHAKTINESSNPEQQKDVVAPAEESTKVETKKEEDVEVNGAETSPAAEPEKVPNADEATVAETKEKEP